MVVAHRTVSASTEQTRVPLPGRTSSTPKATRDCTASRRVFLPTENSSIKARSVGSLSPAFRSPLRSLSSRSSATAVAVRAGTQVSMVRATFAGGGSDAMRPVGGWAVLAHLGSLPGGHVAAYNARGRLVDMAPVPRPTNPGGPREVSNPTFVRTTHQGVLIVGHTVGSFLSPDVADGSFVMVGLEGLEICRPANPRGLAPGVRILSGDGQPPGSMGPPITLVVVHSGTAIARVEVVFANHVADLMAPIGGQAVLATLGTVANNAQLGTLQPATVYGFDRQGRRVASVQLTPESNGSCIPSV